MAPIQSIMEILPRILLYYLANKTASQDSKSSTSYQSYSSNFQTITDINLQSNSTADPEGAQNALMKKLLTSVTTPQNYEITVPVSSIFNFEHLQETTYNFTGIPTNDSLVTKSSEILTDNFTETYRTYNDDVTGSTLGRHISAMLLVTICVHLAGIWTRFLMDRAQRETFIETRQCIKCRLKLERENYNQVSCFHSKK